MRQTGSKSLNYGYANASIQVCHITVFTINQCYSYQICKIVDMIQDLLYDQGKMG